MKLKLVVGVDGSEHANRAVVWCANYATALDAEVVVVHAIDIPLYVSPVIASFVHHERMVRPTYESDRSVPGGPDGR